MHAYEAFTIRPACGEGRHVFVSLGTAEKPAVHDFLQPCMCGAESFGSEEMMAWGHPFWAAMDADRKQAMADMLIRASAGTDSR